MKNRRLLGLAAAALGAATLIVAPAEAFRGGGGFGGMHGGGMHFGGGGGFGGMHGGAAHFGGGGFGAMHVGAAHFGGNNFRGGMAFGPRVAPFVHQRAVFHNFGFRHRHFNNVVFVGGPYYGVGYGDTCWRRVWTYYGWQWANICSDYGY
jgi:hypothetical protein